MSEKTIKPSEAVAEAQANVAHYRRKAAEEENHAKKIHYRALLQVWTSTLAAAEAKLHPTATQ